MEDFIEFQDVLHSRKQISDQNLDPVLEIAKKYSFDFVLKKSEDFLIENSKFSFGKKMELAREFDLKKLKDHLKSLDESENCAISTDSLKCTVCYEIYPGVPMSIQCGHTFCTPCLENLKKTSSANCPICRKIVNFSTAVPNFTLKNVLDSLGELGKNEKGPYENSKDIAYELLQGVFDTNIVRSLQHLGEGGDLEDETIKFLKMISVGMKNQGMDAEVQLKKFRELLPENKARNVNKMLTYLGFSLDEL
ncbi:hypothetical protein B9Z55_007803 [Caenorhabditis nigoni]|uniref:RING-type domain-containing protein n=1 Tax=Caenorhabditis nigoni TaxID=1611254 RepID=A0A2G5VBA2_9PELO|nr:hypothetical protein B9Z55_007803 [Caenorhabditis nigoni]